MQATFFALLFSATPAIADQIDGEWCSEDGKHLTINGPKIRIPSGKLIIGDYDRHGFIYTGPEGDPEAGQKIRMVQQNHEHMKLYRSTAPKSAEDWRRCQVVS